METTEKLHPCALANHLIETTQHPDDPEGSDYALVVLNAQKRPIYAVSGPLIAIAGNVASLIGHNQIKTGKGIQILSFHGQQAGLAMQHVSQSPNIETLRFFGPSLPAKQICCNPRHVPLSAVLDLPGVPTKAVSWTSGAKRVPLSRR